MGGAGAAVGRAEDRAVPAVGGDPSASDADADHDRAVGSGGHAAGLERGTDHLGDGAAADDVNGVGQLVGDEDGVGDDGDAVVGLAADGHRLQDLAARQGEGHEVVVGLLGNEQRTVGAAQEQVPGRAGQGDGPSLGGLGQVEQHHLVGVAHAHRHRGGPDDGDALRSAGEGENGAGQLGLGGG